MSTRAALDHHLDELGTRIDVTKERVKAQAQYWGGIGAVAAGLIGIVVFWPRSIHRRHVRPFSVPAM